MPKEEKVELEGEVVEALPNAMFRVKLDNMDRTVLGHVAGLTLAHDRALAVYRRVRDATRSQYWMLAIMVGFTSLGLWLLSASAQS